MIIPFNGDGAYVLRYGLWGGAVAIVLDPFQFNAEAERVGGVWIV